MTTVLLTNTTAWTNNQYILFEYLYRDGGNFKAHGSIALIGILSDSELDSIRESFETDGLFIAEQIGVAPLYEKLYYWSGGANSLDHCWHEFQRIAHVPNSMALESVEVWGAASDFYRIVTEVTAWNGSLSPHFRSVPAA
jgi:hypothetical protein